MSCEGGEREGEAREREGRIGRGVSGREKIKQIGMQRTTTGGWNEGGVKLGQLGVAAPRGWDQYSLFLSSALANYSNCTQGYANLFAFFSSIFLPTHTHARIYLYIYIYTPVFLFPRWFVTRASQPIPPPVRAERRESFSQRRESDPSEAKREKGRKEEREREIPFPSDKIDRGSSRYGIGIIRLRGKRVSRTLRRISITRRYYFIRPWKSSETKGGLIIFPN